MNDLPQFEHFQRLGESAAALREVVFLVGERLVIDGLNVRPFKYGTTEQNQGAKYGLKVVDEPGRALRSSAQNGVRGFQEGMLQSRSSGLSLRQPGSGHTMAHAPDESLLAEAVLDAPLVVHVEVGAVSMSAAEWAKLKPGDVIETGVRLAEPVVLRVAGRAVARGELVDVDGELGVRVRELFRE